MMKEEKVGRRDFLKKVPLFGAGLALGTSALAEADEAPKVRKISGGDVRLLGTVCNIGECKITCNTGDGSSCNTGITYYYCNVGSS